MPSLPRSCHQDVYQGWRGPSLRRPPGDRGPPGSECILYHPPYPLPHLQVLMSVRPLPVAPLCCLPFVDGVRVCLGPVRSLSPLLPRASESSLPLCAHAASFSSPSLSPLYVLPASSAARPFLSGARRWHTAPDIFRTCRCDWPCGTRIARSCTSTWDLICNRRRRRDKLIVLVPWCEPPAPFPPPSPLPPP